ncbi:PadR family transcriptional regulator [Planotetraspora kaengkrachanensis]|uniref:Negative transcription regulator PadR n=1 Tax=Planotetraspora kaengkrachanensis TaxID=575193 RepID=A0A8J3PWG1_9ACTN|nr:PadR family transcriptional regulator [Planotetraspora kaengkrachanensis]GIG82337.1 negative transcription regulator PadR [Planotetraspora kaengkrachanensis]
MSLRIALLGLLTASGPSSGYDLAKKFETSVAHVWQAGHSQIYPELAKMSADGLVAVEAEGARGRKIYRVTPDGDAELRRWLLAHDPSTTVRSETALQSFLVPLLEPGEALTVMRRLKDRGEAHLSELEALRVRKDAVMDPAHRWGMFGAYALDLGLRQARCFVEWADDSIADIERRAGAGQGAPDPT